MTETTQQQPATKTKKRKASKPAQPTRAARIRTLLTEGRSVAEIAAVLGVTKQTVYNVAHHARKKAQNAVRISPRTGKPLRKYTKREGVKAEVLAEPSKKVEALIVVPKPEFLRMQQELETLRNRRPVEVEIPVPQPFSHYTFTQRLRILFFGGAA